MTLIGGDAACHDPEDTWGCHPCTGCPWCPVPRGWGVALGGGERLGKALQVPGGPCRSWGGSVQHPDPTMPWWSQGTVGGGGAEWWCPPQGGPCWSQGTPRRVLSGSLLVPGVPRELCPLQPPQSHHVPVVPRHGGGGVGQNGSACSRGVPVGTGWVPASTGGGHLGGPRRVPAPTTTLTPPCPGTPSVPGGGGVQNGSARPGGGPTGTGGVPAGTGGD